MNIIDIATKLLTLRESANPFIMTGMLREELGFDGYGEAIRRRWIMADMEGSGMVQITNELSKIEEMRAIVEKKKCECTCDGECDGECTCTCHCKDKKMESLNEKLMSWTTFTKGNERYHYDDQGKRHKGEAPREKHELARPIEPQAQKVKEDAHFLAISHAHRPRLQEIATLGLGNPQTGAPRDTMAAPSANPQPVRTTPQPSQARAQDVNVGSDVKIVQDGKEYVGKVSAVKSDGKYAVSFGINKPATVRDYDKTEITPIVTK